MLVFVLVQVSQKFENYCRFANTHAHTTFLICLFFDLFTPHNMKFAFQIFVGAFLLVVFTFASNNVYAQSSAGEQATTESRYIVDMPTAGVLAKGRFSVDGYLFGDSGAMVEFNASPFTNLMLGLSFGGSGFLGNSGVRFQALPGFHARFRPFDETTTIPAITIGVSTQGRGTFSDGRFETQSPGVFIAASKNYSFLGAFAIHGGICYSFEQQGLERLPNIYVGFEKTIGSIVSLTAEYNATLDDAYMRSRGGLLNAGLRFNTGRGFTAEVQVRDIFRHFRNATLPYRLVRIEFVGAF
jgi:hypothetical protein